MKTFLLSLFLATLFSTTGFSQEILVQKEAELNSFTFVPNKILLNHQANKSLLVSSDILSVKKHSFLKSTGWLLQGLKFDSVLDEFSANLFDARSYKPKSITDYNQFLMANYLTLQPSKPLVW